METSIDKETPATLSPAAPGDYQQVSNSSGSKVLKCPSAVMAGGGTFNLAESLNRGNDFPLTNASGYSEDNIVERVARIFASCADAHDSEPGKWSWEQFIHEATLAIDAMQDHGRSEYPVEHTLMEQVKHDIAASGGPYDITLQRGEIPVDEEKELIRRIINICDQTEGYALTAVTLRDLLRPYLRTTELCPITPESMKRHQDIFDMGAAHATKPVSVDLQKCIKAATLIAWDNLTDQETEQVTKVVLDAAGVKYE